MDFGSEFCSEFDDHAGMKRVAEMIVTYLLRGQDLPISDSEHPFNKYASPDKTDLLNLRALGVAVLAEFVHIPGSRPYVISFFHSGGVNRESFDELYEVFVEWMRISCTPSQNNEPGHP